MARPDLWATSALRVDGGLQGLRRLPADERFRAHGVDKKGFFLGLRFFLRVLCGTGIVGASSGSPISAAWASIAPGFVGANEGRADREGGSELGAPGALLFFLPVSRRTSPSTRFRVRDFLRRGRTGASFMRTGRASVVPAGETSSGGCIGRSCLSPGRPARAILTTMSWRLRSTRNWVLASSLALAVPAAVCPAHHAQAAEITKEQARALFQEALALVAAGDYATALDKLQQVASFKRTPQVVYYIAVCHEKTGKLVMALGEYRIALADGQAAGAQDVVDEASAAIKNLEPRIPMLTIDKGEGAAAATILVDGKEIGDAAIGLPMPFDPGTRVVVAQASGYRPFRQEVKLAEGEKTAIEVSLKKRAPGAAVAPTPDSDGDDTAEDPSASLDTKSLDEGSNTLAWLTTGVGVVGLGASAYFFSQRSKAISDLDDACGSNKNACPASMESTYDDGKRDTLFANVALGVGVVGVATGIILFATSGSSSTEATEQPKQPDQPGLAWRVVPSSPGSVAGVSLDARF